MNPTLAETQDILPNGLPHGSRCSQPTVLHLPRQRQRVQGPATLKPGVEWGSVMFNRGLNLPVDPKTYRFKG